MAASKTVCTVKTAVEKAVVAVYLKGRPVNTPSLLHPILKMWWEQRDMGHIKCVKGASISI